MALYGRNKDVLLFQGLNTELLHRIIEQQVGYYKPKLDDTPSNIYGEAQNKTWIGPVLLKCNKFRWLIVSCEMENRLKENLLGILKK